jgi:hypothetical protein
MNRDARLALIGLYREQHKPDLAREHLNWLREQHPDDPAMLELEQEMNP